MRLLSALTIQQGRGHRRYAYLVAANAASCRGAHQSLLFKCAHKLFSATRAAKNRSKIPHRSRSSNFVEWIRDAEDYWFAAITTLSLPSNERQTLNSKS